MSMTPQQRFPYLSGLYCKANAYNGARGGNTTIHSLNILLNKVYPKKPDYVCMLHNVNDVIQLVNYDSLYVPANNRSVIETHSVGFSVGLKYVLEAVVPGIYRRYLERSEGEFKDVSNRKGYNYKGLLKEFEANLRIFVAITKSIGATPILMTQFNRLTELPDDDVQKHYNSGPFGGLPYVDFLKLYTEANNIIRNIGSSEEVMVIDLDNEVPKNIEHMYDAVHLTPKGAELVAQIISARIGELMNGTIQVQ